MKNNSDLSMKANNQVPELFFFKKFYVNFAGTFITMKTQ